MFMALQTMGQVSAEDSLRSQCLCGPLMKSATHRLKKVSGTVWIRKEPNPKVELCLALL
jgi:hypothetical protein